MLSAIRPYNEKPLTPQEFEVRARAYFTTCEVAGTPPTKTGLAYYTGFRNSADLDLHRCAEGWCDYIQPALTFVAMQYEMRLILPGATGCMFALKNIDNWTDRQTVALEDTTPGGKPASAIETHLTRLQEMKAVAATLDQAAAPMALPDGTVDA